MEAFIHTIPLKAYGKVKMTLEAQGDPQDISDLQYLVETVLFGNNPKAILTASNDEGKTIKISIGALKDAKDALL